ncbi:MAG: HD domain-containing protein [Massiliimalia sp.]|jgi:hypothetical protein
MDRLTELVRMMIEYEAGVPERIHHFMKVLAFSRLIGKSEHIDESTLEILETAAVLHDVGIKESLRKYETDTGNYQELEGPPIARRMMLKLGYPEEMIRRVCYLVGHHHTYTDVDGMDYQILIEADGLVNMMGKGMHTPEILRMRQSVFRTKTGIEFLDNMYLKQSDKFESKDL